MRITPKLTVIFLSEDTRALLWTQIQDIDDVDGIKTIYFTSCYGQGLPSLPPEAEEETMLGALEENASEDNILLMPLRSYDPNDSVLSAAAGAMEMVVGVVRTDREDHVPDTLRTMQYTIMAREPCVRVLKNIILKHHRVVKYATHLRLNGLTQVPRCVPDCETVHQHATILVVADRLYAQYVSIRNMRLYLGSGVAVTYISALEDSTKSISVSPDAGATKMTSRYAGTYTPSEVSVMKMMSDYVRTYNTLILPYTLPEANNDTVHMLNTADVAYTVVRTQDDAVPENARGGVYTLESGEHLVSHLHFLVERVLALLLE